MQRVLSGIFFIAMLATTSAGAEERFIDRIVVEKSQRQTVLMAGSRVVRTYDIALGSVPFGDKQQEGDGRTPEGNYVIEGRNARSSYHLSLKISYPHAASLPAATSSSTARRTGGCCRGSRRATVRAAASP
jgi:murein L,D-transpeptidase YafK